MHGFALVGCGRIAPKHVEAIATSQRAKLCAVCDIVPERAQRIAVELGVPSYVDMHDMMSREPAIDIVSILTPSGLHPEHVIELAQYGKPIIVEKPMALRVTDADRMIEACDRSGAPLFVVKQNRYNRPVIRLREALEAGRFGRPIMGAVRVRWCRRQAYYDQDAWRGTWALDGGVFGNQASHHVDLLQWLLGPVDSVMAESGRFCSKIEAHDTGAALFRFKSGAIGVAEATTCTRPQDLEGSLTIMGDRGVVEIGGFAVNEVRVWQFEDGTAAEAEEIKETCGETPPNVYGYGHRAYLEHILDVVEHGVAALVDGLEGRKSVELVEAIAESAASGARVDLPFRPRASRLGGGYGDERNVKWGEADVP